MSTTDRGGPMMIGLGVLIVGFIIGYAPVLILYNYIATSLGGG